MPVLVQVDNEVYSFERKSLKGSKKYMFSRETLKLHINEQMRVTHHEKDAHHACARHL